MRKFLVLPVLVAIAACGGSSPSSGSTGADVGSGSLTGAGSTFVQPLFQAAFFQYQQDHSSISINYQPVGSGAGIQQFTAGTVDFGASDVPMSSTELAAAGGASSLVQIPDTLGAVAIGYNLPGVDKLHLDGPTLADIYLGKVKKWNDLEITALNSGVSLPGTSITVVHRSDGSGTSYIFTDYLSKVSSAWAAGPGKGKSVSWPAGVGAKGSSGVGGQIAQTPGGIGYVELAYVVQSKMQQAYLKNASGTYVQASQAGATAAAAADTGLSATNFSIVDSSGAAAYPIAGYSWAFIRTDISGGLEKARALVYLFKWLDTTGQQYGASLQYAALPSAAQSYAIGQLKLVTSGGKAILT